MKYESRKMIARREHIVETALDMMARDDGEFTMRDLAKESGVATGTLYNLFGSQDALVAEAVGTVFEERVSAMVVLPDSDDIAELIRARNEASFQEIMRVPAYAIKMMQIYFAGEPGSPVRKRLHDIPRAAMLALLEGARDADALEKWVDVDRLADEMVAAQYAVVARWAAQEIDDEQLRQGTTYAALALLAGALKGVQRRQVIDALERPSNSSASEGKTTDAA